MKQKLFLLLTVLAISIGTLWAQSSTTTNYTWDELYQEPYVAISGSATIMYKYAWARGGGSYPAFWFYILFNKSEMVTYNGRTYPAKGAYTISSNLSNPNVIGNYQVGNTESGSSTYCRTEYDKDGSTYYYPISGSGKVYEGADLPYITYSATSNRNKNGYTVSTGQYQKIYVNIGTAATYRTVTVQSESTTKGTVDYAMKSGYFYTDIDGTYCKHWKNNSVYTLTASPKSGYRFVCWKKGSTQISTNAVTDVTITGNATYTAYFEPQGGTQYTITTAVSPSNTYGTVTGAGSYYENNPATLTATSANEHLYFFDHWEVGGSTYAGGATITPTVTGDATYTAVFRTASNGTITANTSLPAGGSVVVNQPSTAGGTAVILTVNVNEGYTFTGWADGGDDNPRTVYVDGDHTYTAQIVEGVTIDIQAAMTSNHGFGWGYCFYYWAKTYGYDIMIRAIDNWSWAAGDNMGISDINTSESYINDHGVTVRFTAFTATCYNQDGKNVLDATATGNNGKNYRLILRGHSGSYSNEQTEAYSQTYGSYAPEHDSGNIYYFTTQNGSGDYYSVTWKSQIVFITDESLCGTIPSGIYQASDTWDDGTLLSDGYTYGNYKLNSSSFMYMPATGYAEVVNRDETYYVLVDGYNSAGYSFYQTIGTTPYSVTVSSNSNSYGSAGIVWHSSNCGDVAYGAGTQKFFNGNSITLTASANSGYEFWRWSDEDASVVNSAYGTSRNVTVSGNLTLQAIFREEATNHTVTITAPENGTITVSYNDGGAQSFTSGSRDIAEGTVLTVTTTPAADYHFGAWTGNGAASVTVDGAKTIGATFAQNDYFLNATYGTHGTGVTRDDSGNSETVKRAGNTVTLTPTAATGYNFLAWAGADVANMSGNAFTFPTNGTHNTTYNVQATFQAITYNLTYNGLEGATNTNPATYTVESETITLADPGARDGYAFIGWTCGGEAITEITAGSTGDKTITANWNKKLSSITLEDNRENSFYNTFKTTYDGESGLIVTYARQFTAGRWSTLCLPFNVNKAMFSSLNFGSRIYEFKYATGNADDGVNLYFSIAKSIEAGKGYIVNADATLAARTSFTFPGVTMDLSADNGAELNSVTAYDNLTNGCSTKDSNIELVGTLRKGTLKGTDKDNRYMGLKGNKIYYPNITTGSTILAYRGIFRSIEGTLNAERIRIIVDGEEKAELEVINGELQDVQDTKKFIENGVLYIERNGVIYDATGRKVE